MRHADRKALQTFRAISVAEGLSYLAILAVTVGLLSREFVFSLGVLHGALFVLYVVVSLLVTHLRRWSVMAWLGLLLAAIVPFAFLAVEFRLRGLAARAGESA